MGDWVSLATEILWRNTLGAVPLILAVLLICRFVPCRPTTRHSFWLIILVWFLVAAALPTSDLIGRYIPGPTARLDHELTEPGESQEIRESGLSKKAAHADALLPDLPADDIKRIVARVPTEKGLFSRRNAGRQTPSVTRPRAGRFESRSRERLAQAPRSVRPALGEFVADDSAVKSRPPSPAQPSPEGRDDSPIVAAREASPPVFLPIPSSRTHIDERDTEPEDNTMLAHATRQIAGEPRWVIRDDFAGPTTEAASNVVSDESPPQLQAKAPSPPVVDAERVQPAVVLGWRVRASEAWGSWVAGFASLRVVLGGLKPLPSGVWCLGALLCVLSAAVRMGMFRRRMRLARPAPESVRRLVRDCANGLGMRRVPETLMTSERVSPMVWFGGRVRLILPEALWRDLDADGRRAVVCHELAHIRRRDHWVNWLQLFVMAFYWWNPLVWWVRRRLNEEAEFCCDTWVTWLYPRHRRAYAEALLITKEFVTTASQRTPVTGIGVMTGRAARFARRLKMVMTDTRRPGFSASGLVLALALCAAGWIATPALSCPKHKKSKQVVPQAKTLLKYVAPDATPLPEPMPQYILNSQPRFAPVPVVVGTVAPPVAILVDDPRSDGIDRELAELDMQIARLNTQMAEIRRSLASAKRSASRAGRGRVQPRSSRGRNPLAPSRPSTTIVIADSEKTWRSYMIASGKLEGLTKLMSLNSVPIMIRPGDGEIEVQGTPFEHAVFDAFVRMIGNGEQEYKSFALPSDKLEAMSELMVRSDVPIYVSPQDDHIRVNGNELEQLIFGAFVNMINPTGQRHAQGETHDNLFGRSGVVQKRLRTSTEGEMAKSDIVNERLRAEKLKIEVEQDKLNNLQKKKQREMETLRQLQRRGVIGGQVDMRDAEADDSSAPSVLEQVARAVMSASVETMQSTPDAGADR